MKWYLNDESDARQKRKTTLTAVLLFLLLSIAGWTFYPSSESPSFKLSNPQPSEVIMSKVSRSQSFAEVPAWSRQIATSSGALSWMGHIDIVHLMSNGYNRSPLESKEADLPTTSRSRPFLPPKSQSTRAPTMHGSSSREMFMVRAFPFVEIEGLG